MATSALMSQLEAVNTILEAIEEAPVSSLLTSGLRPLEKAKAALTEASRVVQTTGWKFNTERDFPLVRDGSGQITLPSNVLMVDVNDEYTDVEPVQRGLRLYDGKAHSYSFSRDLKATVVFLLEWDELPQAARYYITIKAARIAQGRSSVSDSVYRFTEADENHALLAFSDQEAQVGDHNMLRDSWSVANILQHRRDF